jgi:hypothetical protein
MDGWEQAGAGHHLEFREVDAVEMGDGSVLLVSFILFFEVFEIIFFLWCWHSLFHTFFFVHVQRIWWLNSRASQQLWRNRMPKRTRFCTCVLLRVVGKGLQMRVVCGSTPILMGRSSLSVTMMAVAR